MISGTRIIVPERTNKVVISGKDTRDDAIISSRTGLYKFTTHDHDIKNGDLLRFNSNIISTRLEIERVAVFDRSIYMSFTEFNIDAIINCITQFRNAIVIVFTLLSKVKNLIYPSNSIIAATVTLGPYINLNTIALIGSSKPDKVIICNERIDVYYTNEQKKILLPDFFPSLEISEHHACSEYQTTQIDNMYNISVGAYETSIESIHGNIILINVHDTKNGGITMIFNTSGNIRINTITINGSRSDVLVVMFSLPSIGNTLIYNRHTLLSHIDHSISGDYIKCIQSASRNRNIIMIIEANCRFNYIDSSGRTVHIYAQGQKKYIVSFKNTYLRHSPIIVANNMSSSNTSVFVELPRGIVHLPFLIPGKSYYINEHKGILTTKSRYTDGSMLKKYGFAIGENLLMLV